MKAKLLYQYPNTVQVYKTEHQHTSLQTNTITPKQVLFYKVEHFFLNSDGV